MDVIFPEFHSRGMESALKKNLRERMDALELNALQAAKKAGLGDSFVRDIMRGKTKSPSAENLNKLAAALGTTADALTGRSEARPIQVPIVGLPVVSEVQAGNWLEVSHIDEDPERETIPAGRDPRFPGAIQYALRVRGDSMDEEYPDGSYVTCVDFWDAGIAMKPGLRVHVERQRAGGQLVEITVKAIENIDGKLYLVPKSTNSKWRPVPVEGDEDAVVAIKGIVTGGWKPTPI